MTPEDWNHLGAALLCFVGFYSLILWMASEVRDSHHPYPRWLFRMMFGLWLLGLAWILR